MRPPYFRVTAECPNARCVDDGSGRFTVERRNIKKRSTHGQEYTISIVVCPICRMWAKVIRIEEVR